MTTQGEATEQSRPDIHAPSTTDPLVGTQRDTDDPREAQGTPEVEVKQSEPGAGEAIKSRKLAALFAIVFGALGVHRFYLGYRVIGLFQLAMFVALFVLVAAITTIRGATPGAAMLTGISAAVIVPIWTFIEGVLIILGGLNKDGAGRPLAA